MNVKYTNRDINNIYWGILIVILLTLINNGYFESGVISIVIYAIQMFMIMSLALKERGLLSRIFNKPIILLSAIIIIANILSSTYDADYSLLIKYFGYIVALCVGFNTANNINIRLSNTLLIGIVLVPLFMVVVFDKSPVKDTFFPNTNNFVFWGAVSSLLYYISSSNKRKYRTFIIILLAYILAGSTIGIVLALMAAITFVNVRSIKSFAFVSFTFIILILLVSYSDIAIFTRIRAVIQTLSYADIRSINDIENLNLYELNQYANAGERSDNTSALWRIQQWLGLISAFLNKWYYTLLIGLGDNYTTYKTGLPPHNDFLKILCEYGMIVFIAYFKYIIRAIRILYNSNYIYIVLTIVIFHFSENLIHTFPTNFTFYFCIGYACAKTLDNDKKLEYENTSN